MPNKQFGSRMLDIDTVFPRKRAIVADFNLFITKQEFVVIYFTRSNQQQVKVFDSLDKLQRFLERYITKVDDEEIG